MPNSLVRSKLIVPSDSRENIDSDNQYETKEIVKATVNIDYQQLRQTIEYEKTSMEQGKTGFIFYICSKDGQSHIMEGIPKLPVREKHLSIY